MVPKTETRTTRVSGPQNSDQDNQGKYTFFFSADGPGVVNELYTELYTKLYIVLYSKLYTKTLTVASRCVTSDCPCQHQLQNSGLASSLQSAGLTSLLQSAGLTSLFFITERWSSLFITERWSNLFITERWPNLFILLYRALV